MYKSNEEFFQSVYDLASSLKHNGHVREADVLNNGMVALNGLTDGWAQLLDAVREVESNAAVLTDAEKEAIGTIHDAVYQAVYRRKRKGRWRFWLSGGEIKVEFKGSGSQLFLLQLYAAPSNIS